MTDHLNLIRIKLQHLSRMRDYLAYSLSQVESVLKLTDWTALSPDQHESLAKEAPALFGYFNQLQAHTESLSKHPCHKQTHPKSHSSPA